MGVAAVLVVLCAVLPARAQDDARIAALEADIARQRDRIEALWVSAARQHEALRTVLQRGESAWMPTGDALDTLERVVESARASSDPDGKLEELAALSGPEDAWSAWAPALLAALAERARTGPDHAPPRVFRELLQDVAARDVHAAWDAFMSAHPVVRDWTEANRSLADARRQQRARAPTPLVALPKARIEVGPWDGWLQDLSEKDNRAHKVTVGAIHVQQHEVTWAQYVEFLLAQPAGKRAALMPRDALDTNDGDPLPPYGREDHPVTGVSYVQAAAYAEWLGMRLPSEDEWERIATAGLADRRFPWGEQPGSVRFASRSLGNDGTVAVSFCPDDATPEGVLGLAGNVKELVATHPDRKPVKRTPKADDRVVIRGGGFRTRPDECTTRWRWFVEAGAQEPDVGFRCVIDDADLKRRDRR
jgi:formylglycine-generating enzyme required for sulfatase activity